MATAGHAYLPDDRTSLSPLPPYHVAHNVIQVAFRADPAALRPFIPEPFTPGPEPDLAMAVVLDAVYTWGDETRRLAPDFHQCLEAFLIVPVRYGSLLGKHFGAVYVDRDWLFAASHYVGMSGRMARIQLTRLHPLHRTLNAPRPGLRMEGAVERAGERVLSMALELRRQVAASELPLSSMEWRNFGLRSYPAVEGGAGFRDVVTVASSDRQMGEVWEAAAELSFGDSSIDRLAALRPRQIVAAHYAAYRYTMDGVQPVAAS